MNITIRISFVELQCSAVKLWPFSLIKFSEKFFYFISYLDFNWCLKTAQGQILHLLVKNAKHFCQSDPAVRKSH